MCFLFGITFFCMAPPAIAQNKASDIISKHMNKMQKEAAAKKEASEKRIQKLSAQQKEALEAYRKLTARLEALKQNREKYLSSLKTQKKRLEIQAAELQQTPELEHKANTLLVNMTDTLEAFIKADLPFHKEKRLNDIVTLRTAINSTSMAPAQKIKAVFNSYANELSYGRSIETYDDKLYDARFCRTLNNRPGEELVVTFMRYGRLALAFTSPDAKLTAFWNKNRQCWQTVSGTLALKISEAIGVAEKRIPPGFITFPVTQEQLSKITSGNKE